MSLDLTISLHQLVMGLPRLNHLTPLRSLPSNGIYLFYESDETTELLGSQVDRIVRVGTHRRDGRFPGRIRQHYGRAASLRGNKNSSVFRRHVGGALLRRSNPSDPRLEDWLMRGGPTSEEVEVEVSRVLRSRFTFVCFRVDTPNDRLELESGLIALLAHFPLGSPSTGWLGHSAESPIIRHVGLWNIQHVDSTPLSAEQFQTLRELVELTQEGASQT